MPILYLIFFPISNKNLQYWVLAGGKDSQIWISGPISKVNIFQENLQYLALYWVAKTVRFEYQAWYQRFFLHCWIKIFDIEGLWWQYRIKLWYRVWYWVQCWVHCIVLTSDAYDRTGSCCAPSIWMMNAQGMRKSTLILQIKSFYHPLHSNCTRYHILYHTLYHTLSLLQQ